VAALRRHERYVLTLSIVFSLTVILITAYGPGPLDLYVSLLILGYFVVTALHSPMNPRAERILSLLSAVLFAVFMLIVANKVVEILLGVRLF